MSIRSHTVSIRYAWAGIAQGLRTQPNFRIHLLLSLFSLLAGLYFQISSLEFLIIIILIGIGLTVEYLNTAIEYTVDLLTDKHHLLAKYAKDCAAAAMLVYAFFAFFCACWIFLPKIMLWLSI